MKCAYQIDGCETHVFSFEPIDARMYIVLSKGCAVVIDPCVHKDAMSLLRAKGITEIIIIPTHEHYDHISGVNWLKECFQCTVVANRICAAYMLDQRRNASKFFEALFLFASAEIKGQIKELQVQPYSCSADLIFDEFKQIEWEGHVIEVFSTPGHSPGSMCIVIDKLYVFTGDSLIPGKEVVLRLPGGDKATFERKTLPFLRSLPSEAIIYPGHGEATKFIGLSCDAEVACDRIEFIRN